MTTRKVGNRRLLKVAQALRESPNPRKFDMCRFVHSCGTPACALGHYAARRDMQRLFSLFPTADIRSEALEAKGYDDPQDAAEEHFALERWYDYKRLFYEDGCGRAKTAIQAARFIERFVKERGE